MSNDTETIAALQAEIAQLRQQVAACTARAEAAQAEAAATRHEMQQSQSLLRQILDNTPTPIYVKDTQGRYLLVNQHFLDIFQMSENALIGKTDECYLPPEIAQAVRANDSAVRANQQPLQMEETIAQADGTRIYLSVKYPIYDTAGTIFATGGISTDITERKKLEEETRRRDYLLHTITGSMPMVLYEVDAAGIFTRSEGKGLENLGMEPGQAVGLSVFDIYRDIPEVVAYHRKVLAGESVNYLIEVSKRIFESWAVPIYDPNGAIAGAAGVSLDITERRGAEAESTRLNEEVIEAQRIALRELSTPLIPIAEDVVIMPLIGTIDSQRAQMVMETLLDGVARYQAATAILDVTGVQLVDSQVANALLQAAQAVRLLGARVMLTGIQPQIAQTLVHLGIELSAIDTRGTLQDGIAAVLTPST